MRLTILAINYNGSENTIKLLKSLSEQTDNDFNVFIIDNASQEADLNNLRDNWPTSQVSQFELVINKENLGFSGGSNVGIRKALEMGVSWVLLLNNDTWAEDDLISSIKPILKARNGIVGIALDESKHVAYCGRIKWLKPHGHHLWKPEECENWPISQVGQFDKYAIGGAMAIHRDVLEKIGLLDEKYFLYFEDQDFSLRAKKAGFPLSFINKVMVHHQVSSSTKKLGSSLLFRYHYRNALYFNWKNGPWPIKLAVWPWSWWVMAKQLIKVMIYHNREQSLAILRGVFDFYRNKMGRIK